MHRDRKRHSMLIAWWILLALIIGTVIFVRIRLLAIPLERDEGEYAYAGQLMLHGIPPYQLAYNMKFPGIYAAYALVMAVFGESDVAIHLGLLLANLVAIALLFAVALRLTNALGGIIAAATYAVLSLSPSVLGLAAHAEHFVLVPALAASLLLIRNQQPLRPLQIMGSGLLFGLAILMKQPAVFFLLFGGGYLLYQELRGRARWPTAIFRVALFGVAAIVPILLAFLALWIAGVFPKFWFWTIDYARAYGSIVPFGEGILIGAHETQKILRAIWPLCILGTGGAAALVLCRPLRKHIVFFLLLLIASTAALCSGLYFREHYYVFFFPLLSLLAGVGVIGCFSVFTRWSTGLNIVLLAVVTAALAYPMVDRYRLLFVLSPDAAGIDIYRGNIFRDGPRIGLYLREHSAPADTIAVIGSEPEIYFYARRHSATGYIYTYALMEEHQYAGMMQEEMEHEIESARPKFLVFVSLQTSWFIAPWSDQSIFRWGEKYCSTHYRRVGVVNVLPDGLTNCCLPCDAKSPSDSVVIFARNENE